MTEDEIGRQIVDVAVRIHRGMGPRLLETVYEVILVSELPFEALTFDEGFRADLIVENKVIVELKCAQKLSNAHRKQLLTYLRLTHKRLRFLLNFSEALMKHGITRIVNRLHEDP